MKRELKNFLFDDEGAITVDFVVLTAAIFLMGAVVVASFDYQAIGMAEDTATIIESQLD